MGTREIHHPIQFPFDLLQGKQSFPEGEGQSWSCLLYTSGIIAARPLDGVEHAAHGVENAAAQHPEKAGRGEQAQQGEEGHHRQPAHEDIDAGGEPAGGGDPGQGEMCIRDSLWPLSQPLPEDRAQHTHSSPLLPF